MHACAYDLKSNVTPDCPDAQLAPRLRCTCQNVPILLGIHFRSLVSIQGPEGYGPSTLPLRHSEAIW